MESELFGSQIALAYAASTLMKWLKYQRWFPLMQQEATVLNRIFAIVLALATSMGIHYTFDVDEGTMVITGLTLAGIAHSLWAWFTQFAFQQGAFKLIVQPEEVKQQLRGELPTTSLTTETGDGK